MKNFAAMQHHCLSRCETMISDRETAARTLGTLPSGQPPLVDAVRQGLLPSKVGGGVAALDALPTGVLGPILFEGGDLLFAGEVRHVDLQR